MIREWQDLPEQARKRTIQLAIENLELNSMYYEQKGNARGIDRSEKCIRLLKENLALLDG